MIGIYKLVNTYNGKVYIGQSNNIERRFEEHLGELKKKKHKNKRLQRDYNRYSNYFETIVIEECSLHDLNRREIYWIKQFDSTDPKKGYNIESGGGYKRKVRRRSLLDRLTD